MRAQVLYYPDLSTRPNDHMLDAIVRAERRSCDSPALVVPIHAGSLMKMAGISPTAWKAYVLERHGLDLAAPDEAALRKLLPHASEAGIESSLRTAQENAETAWSLPEEDVWSFAWEVEEDVPQALACDQVWEIVQETGGKGLVFLAYMDDATSILEALSDDNDVVVSPSVSGEGAMIGLVDPVNGTGHFVMAGAPVSCRPAAGGKVAVGADDLMETFQISDDAFPGVTVEVRRAEPVRMSSRSEHRSNFPAPKVDLSALHDVAPAR